MAVCNADPPGSGLPGSGPPQRLRSTLTFHLQVLVTMTFSVMMTWKRVVLVSMLSTIFSAVYKCESIKGGGMTSSSSSSSSEHLPEDPELPPIPQAYTVQYNNILSAVQDEEEGTELGRTWIPRYKRERRQKRQNHSPLAIKRKNGKVKCALKEMPVRITDLGLGYVSEEVIKFGYCVGSCEHKIKTYDVVVSNLRQLNHIVKETLLQEAPCCRPLEYDGPVGFLDVNNRYKILRKVSATKCGCV